MSISAHGFTSSKEPRRSFYHYQEGGRKDKTRFLPSLEEKEDSLLAAD
jgi:hypothetical protein